MPPRKRRRLRPLGPPPAFSSRLYVELPARHVALLKFLLEGYDNLAYLSVLNRRRSTLQVVFSPDQEAEVVRLLDGLRERLALRWFRLAPAA